MDGKVFFVSGIDTGIGKTMATGLMARSLAAAGHDVITVKLVQTGNDGFSEDIDAHRAICGGARFPEDDEGLTAPQIFKFPSSPLLAAALEGRTVDVEAISRAVSSPSISPRVKGGRLCLFHAGGLARSTILFFRLKRQRRAGCPSPVSCGTGARAQIRE